MRYASLVERISGDSVDAWAVHYEALARMEAGEEIFLLSVGQESDHRTSDYVVESAIESLYKGRHHYTGTQGDLHLRQAIARHQGKRIGRELDPETVTVFAGAQNALFATAQLLLESGDEVILIEPYYTTYPATVTAGGARLVGVVTHPETGFQLDPRDVHKAVTPRTKAILINTPNNPTGTIYPEQTISALIDLCREQNMVLISDEVYMDIVDDPTLCRPLSLPGSEDVVISVSSVSKMHRMTGWRVGWAIGPRDIAPHYHNLNTCMCYGLPGFTQDAAAYALNNDHETPKAVKASLTAQRRIVVEELGNLHGIELYARGGGMFVIMNIRELGMDAMDFARGLLDAQNVAVQPCNGFGESCYGLVRISAVLSEDRMREGCRRIADYVSKLPVASERLLHEHT